MALDNKLSNILGVKLPPWLYQQLKTRADRNAEQKRSSNDSVRYLYGKTAWVRLVSSVNITDESDKAYFRRLGVRGLVKDEDLAKQFVLFAGTSKYGNSKNAWLRSGIYNPQNPGKDYSYGILGENEIKEFGYRPMPGIISVNIETQGRLGSVRSATINFKCWDKTQLDIIDALYFKLGYTMFLEWGHTNFFTGSEIKTAKRTLVPGTLYSTEMFMMDPFRSNLKKEDILEQIAENVRDSQGNYDAMLGMTSNFNFTYNQEGGYDCTIKLMSLGILADSIKINHTSAIPGILDEQIKLYNELRDAKRLRDEEIAKQKELERLKAVAKVASKCVAINGEFIIKDEKDPVNNNKTWITYLAENNLTQDQLDSFVPPIKPGGVLDEDAFLTNDKLVEKYDQVVNFEGSQLKQSQVYYSYPFGDTNNEASKNIYFGKGDKEYFYAKKLNLVINRDEEISKNVKVKLNSDAILSVLNRFYDLDKLETLPGISSNDASVQEWFKVNGIGFDTFMWELKTRYKDSRDAQKTYYLGIHMTDMAEVVDSSGEVTKDNPVDPDSGSDLENIYEELDHSAFNWKPDGVLDLPKERFGALVKSSAFLGAEFTFGKNSFTAIPERNESGFSGIGDVYQLSFRDNSTMERLLANAAGNPFVGNIALEAIKNRKYPGFFSLEGYVYFRYVVTRKSDFNLFEASVPSSPQELDFRIPILIISNDTGIIKSWDVRTEDSPPAEEVTGDQTQQTQEGQQENQQQAEDPNAKKSPLSYLSAIEIALRSIQVHALVRSLKIPTADTSVTPVPMTDPTDQVNGVPFLNQIFDSGIFSDFITELANGVYSTPEYVNQYYTTKDPDIKRRIRAQYGFATNLLANRERIDRFKPVNFKELLMAYVVPYEINQSLEEGTQTNHPVYIPFGFFLSLLNHNCVIYDTGTDAKSKAQTPLSYIDFSTEHNLCLSNKQQISTDPFTALIPFEGQNEDFAKIIDPQVLLNQETISAPSAAPQNESEDNANTNPAPTPIWKPISNDKELRDNISGNIPSFKLNDGSVNVQPYRGRIMNILLNIDYLMGLVKGEATRSEENRVTLKPILEQILSSLNKCLGNINVFRLSYVDGGNVYQITDDQVIPPGPGEETLSSRDSRREPLPLVGERSIAKSLDIKTEVSSKLANMLAISANSTDKSTLGSNGDNFGFINTNYVDRYIPNRTEPTSNSASLDGKINVAVKFNNAVKSFYNSINPDPNDVAAATSYYVDRMTKIKGEDTATVASAMIPISLNFKTDGIAGLAMGHAFTIPEVLLPYTYTSARQGKQGQDTDKVGFVVTGLSHTIEGNIWDTSVKTSMIFLKKDEDYVNSKPIERKPTSTPGGFTNFASSYNDANTLAVSPGVDGNLSLLKKSLIKFGITNRQIIIAVLSNAMKETGGQPITEKIDYSGTSNDRIRSIFGSRMEKYDEVKLNQLKRDKQAFIEAIYGVDSGKVGKSLGNTQRGDGFKYIGRGFIQITGKANYSKYSNLVYKNQSLVEKPELLATPQVAADTTAAFISNNLSRVAKNLGLNLNSVNQADANLLVTSIVAGKTLNRANLSEIFTEIMNRVDGYSKSIEKKYDKL